MTIEAMKLALETLEKLNKEGWILADFEDDVYASMEALRAGIEQVEKKEPMYVRDEATGYMYTAPPQQHSEQWWKHEVSNAWAEGYEKGRAQRQWQGLTDEEVKEFAGDNIYCDDPHYDVGDGIGNWLEFARAIEAKLKEKNA